MHNARVMFGKQQLGVNTLHSSAEISITFLSFVTCTIGKPVKVTFTIIWASGSQGYCHEESVRHTCSLDISVLAGPSENILFRKKQEKHQCQLQYEKETNGLVEKCFWAESLTESAQGTYK